MPPLLASVAQWQVELSALSGGTLSQRAAGKLYLRLLSSVLTGLMFACDLAGPLPTAQKCLMQMRGGTSNPGSNKMRSSTSMAGLGRMNSLVDLIGRVASKKVPGSYLEAGVWRGGMSILATAALQLVGLGSRPVYLCDSFAGLPMPRKGSLGATETYYAKFMNRTLAVGEQRVLANFDRFGVTRGQVTTWPGYFVNSLPPLRERLLRTGERLSILRMDGDSKWLRSACRPPASAHMRSLSALLCSITSLVFALHVAVYDSTADILYNLYDLVSVGGYVIIDDFGWRSGLKAKVLQSGQGNSTPFRALFGAKNALLDFRALHGLEDGKHIMVDIDGTGAYFVRRASLAPACAHLARRYRCSHAALPNDSYTCTHSVMFHAARTSVRVPPTDKGQRGDGAA